MTRIRLRAAEEQARDMQNKLEMSTAEIGLTVRTTNCLARRRSKKSTKRWKASVSSVRNAGRNCMWPNA
jgi:DNA-directed RNA polymerase alpha subunit